MRVYKCRLHRAVGILIDFRGFVGQFVENMSVFNGFEDQENDGTGGAGGVL